MKSLTVLAEQNDPYRLDTPAHHRAGEWLAMTAQELGLGSRPIHLRGLHYMVIGRPKPDGTTYTNTADDWRWLKEDAGKSARFLGYIPFEQIVDQRNSAPVVRIFEPPQPLAYLNIDLDIYVPDAADLEPRIGVSGFDGAQPYKIVLVGEKSSLADVLTPIAQSRHADLYLPTGEISDTLIYQMARTGSEDGRPMVVLYFSDADPSGWQMPISVARKLQALKTLEFPGLNFEVHRAALTPDQVREYGLPDSPIKEGEKRGKDWTAAMRVEQTEIDALASLNPKLLGKIARAAIAPFFDTTLDQRVFEAKGRWMTRAQEIIDAAASDASLEALREQVAAKLEEMQEQVDALTEQLRFDVDDFDLPVFEIPAYETNGEVHALHWSIRAGRSRSSVRR
jgi:hypothetical protein